MKGFESFHPAVLFLYYVLVVGISMVSLHPMVLAASVIGGFLLFGAMKGIREVLKEIGFFFSLFLLMSLANPLFVHDGEHILFFMNDNPVTLEAMLYGMASAVMIISVLLWCKCYSEILTTDKFLYLFGKLIPKLGLILSMAFRFIPLFKTQIKKINQSQKTMGLYASPGIPDKVGGGLRVFDCLLSWSMENSVETADAMKARGYGLPGRTCFTPFQFRKRDGILLGIVGVLTAGILISYVLGGYEFYYYPTVAKLSWNFKSVIGYLLLLGFMCIPGVIELKEKMAWNYLKSKI